MGSADGRGTSRAGDGAGTAGACDGSGTTAGRGAGCRCSSSTGATVCGGGGGTTTSARLRRSFSSCLAFMRAAHSSPPTGLSASSSLRRSAARASARPCSASRGPLRWPQGDDCWPGPPYGASRPRRGADVWPNSGRAEAARSSTGKAFCLHAPARGGPGRTLFSSVSAAEEGSDGSSLLGGPSRRAGGVGLRNRRRCEWSPRGLGLRYLPPPPPPLGGDKRRGALALVYRLRGGDGSRGLLQPPPPPTGEGDLLRGAGEGDLPDRREREDGAGDGLRWSLAVPSRKPPLPGGEGERRSNDRRDEVDGERRAPPRAMLPPGAAVGPPLLGSDATSPSSTSPSSASAACPAACLTGDVDRPREDALGAGTGRLAGRSNIELSGLGTLSRRPPPPNGREGEGDRRRKPGDGLRRYDDGW